MSNSLWKLAFVIQQLVWIPGFTVMTENRNLLMEPGCETETRVFVPVSRIWIWSFSEPLIRILDKFFQIPDPRSNLFESLVPIFIFKNTLLNSLLVDSFSGPEKKLLANKICEISD